MLPLTASAHITPQLPTLPIGIDVAAALRLMEESGRGQLPVVEGDRYVGLMGEQELQQLPLAAIVVPTSLHAAPCVRGDSHLLEALQLVEDEGVEVVPVVDEQEHYLGAIEHPALLHALSQLCSTSQEGAMVWVDLLASEYVASLLVRLAEESNAHVIHLLSYPNPMTHRIEVTIKLSTNHADRYVQALERHGVTVKAIFQHDSVADELLQRRVDEVMHYLNM